MQKKFFSSIFLIVVLNILVKPFYIFGIDAQIQNTVSTADYGLYFTLLNLSFLFNIVLDIGINNYNTRNIAQHPQLVSRYLGSIIGLRILLGCLYLFITLLVGFLLNYHGKALYLLFFLALNQFLVGFTFYFRSNFTGMHLFKTDAIFSVLDRLILIVLCLFLLYGNLFETEITIDQFVYAQTISYGIVAFIALLYTRFLKPSKIKINKLFSYAILKQSAPYALLILLMMLYSRTDVIMLDILLADGNKAAGIYAQGFRLLDAINIFALLFASILLPMFARLIKERKSVEPLLLDASKLLITIALAIGCIGYIFAQPIMSWIYTKEIVISATSFKWIVLTFIPIASTYIFGTLLTANGSLRLLNKMAVFGFVFNIILNVFLIPNYQAEGAAIATLLTQTLTALIQLFLAVKLFKIKMNYILLGKWTLFLACVISSSLWIYQTDLITSNLILAFILSVFCSILFAVGVRLISIKEIKGLIKNG
ncbi:MAG: oligosaccharide flippase family protein [Lishizhenia sp.]